MQNEGSSSLNFEKSTVIEVKLNKNDIKIIANRAKFKTKVIKIY